MNERIFLSPPHMGTTEQAYVQEAFDTNWIAPVGPQISIFEEEFAKRVGAKYGVAVSSGTAALHMALRYAGVGTGDEVLCSTFTFIASVAPITYLGAVPVFIDSDRTTWNLDPELLREALAVRAKENRLPKAVVIVHLYGQSADMDKITELCSEYDVPLIEDAAESLGALYNGKHTGTFGQSGIFSFNGNKIITTSGGGMLVTDDLALADKVRFWATQARDPEPHYEHTEIGYNYRLSNVAAAIGRGQLEVLAERVKKKREIFYNYKKGLEDLPGIMFMSEPEGYYSTYWLTCITVDSQIAGCSNQAIMEHLSEKNIECRPLWKPMHLQPVFEKNDVYGGQVSEQLFHAGLCLPSGTIYSNQDYQRIISIIRDCCQK